MSKFYVVYNSTYSLSEAITNNELCIYENEKEMKENYENDFEIFDDNEICFVLLDLNSKTIKTGKIEQVKTVKLVLDK